MTTYAVVSPEGEVLRPSAEPRQAITDMRQAVVAELWDDRFYGNEIFAAVRTELRRRYPGIRIVEHQVFGNTHGVDEATNIGRLPELLRAEGCNAAISAVGA